MKTFTIEVWGRTSKGELFCAYREHNVKMGEGMEKLEKALAEACGATQFIGKAGALEHFKQISTGLPVFTLLMEE